MLDLAKQQHWLPQKYMEEMKISCLLLPLLFRQFFFLSFLLISQTLAEEGHSERIIKDALVSRQGNLQQARQALANARLVSLGSSVSEDDAYTILGLVAGDVELANKYAVASNQLCTIGFTRAETLNALLSTGGDQNLALDCLLNQAK